MTEMDPLYNGTGTPIHEKKHNLFARFYISD